MITDADFQIDIDNKPENIDKLAEETADRMAFITRFMPFRFYQIDIYETTKGYHMYFWSEGSRPKPVEKVLVQMALGSHYRREIFNYKRVWSKKEPPRWNVLYQYKYNDENKLSSKEEKTNNAIKLEEQIIALYTVKLERK